METPSTSDLHKPGAGDSLSCRRRRRISVVLEMGRTLIEFGKGEWKDRGEGRSVLPSEVPTDYPSVPTLVAPDKPAVLAGNSIYWLLIGNFVGILECDLEKQSLGVIRVPAHIEPGQFCFVRAEGGGLGLLFLTGRKLQLWKRKTECDGVASWALGRTIELDKLLSLDSWGTILIGFAEENNVVLLWACGIVYMVHLESLQCKKLFETYIVSYYHPFESVYTAAIGGGHDAADPVNHI